MNKKVLIVVALIVLVIFLVKNKDKKQDVALLKTDDAKSEKGDTDFSTSNIHIYNINYEKGTFDFVATFGKNNVQGTFDYKDQTCLHRNMTDSEGYIFNCKKRINETGNHVVNLTIKNPNTDFSINKCVNLSKKKIS